MEILREEIDHLLGDKKDDAIFLEDCNDFVYPFHPLSKKLAYLLIHHQLSYERYVEMAKEYSHRNRYLYVYEMAPRTCGDTWGIPHICNLYPEFLKATKSNLKDKDPEFHGEYDLWLAGIKVELKVNRATRAGDSDQDKNMASRAIFHEEAVKNSYSYHFQQIKPSCSELFIFIGVCKDELLYWILTRDELLKTNKLKPQHRNENTGREDVEVFEGQIFATEEELKPYRVSKEELLTIALEKGKTQQENDSKLYQESAS